METEFNELIFYPGDISLVEAEEFSYITTVERLDENGQPFIDNVTVTFTQAFQVVPEMIAGVYSTVFRNEVEATLVQDFMEIEEPGTELIGNWTEDGMQYKQTGTADFDPSVYDSYLDGISIASTILEPLPQVLRPSGWQVRDLVSTTVRTLESAIVGKLEVPKNVDTDLGLNIIVLEEFVEPEVQVIIDLKNIEMPGSSGTLEMLRNGVQIGVTIDVSLTDMEYTQIENTQTLTGVTLNPLDVLTFEYRQNRITEVFVLQFYAKYQP